MIRKNDQVIVISGREKGKSGKVLSVSPGDGKALVEKLNRVKRHQKPTPKLKQGGIVEKEAPLPLSNLMLYCSRCSRGVRVGLRIEADSKVRFCKKCREAIPYV